ncbi:hypothetical protein [Clostridium sp. ZBS17]|uniref:hypothetical protein n=1 Tax=Clostridium sp. ZBS17 TaxID=2949968 RepID=UPI00207A60DE|nr:hypothetical protein [Clostridium sp. ZBS17]
MGHMFSGSGIFARSNLKLFCSLLFINIQDGIKAIGNWINPEENFKSHVVHMIENEFSTAEII